MKMMDNIYKKRRRIISASQYNNTCKSTLHSNLKSKNPASFSSFVRRIFFYYIKLFFIYSLLEYIYDSIYNEIDIFHFRRRQNIGENINIVFSAPKDSKSNSLMDLTIADYHRPSNYKFFYANAELYTNGVVESEATSTYGSSVSTVEGCYSDFAVLLQTTYKPIEIDNMICQEFCAMNRFSLSATSGTDCYCGNTFPSEMRKVDKRLCNIPCNPDRTECEDEGCCGGRSIDVTGSLQRFYTVSFAKEVDIILQTLRQLCFDYRTRSKSFRKYIEAQMEDSGMLEIIGGNGYIHHEGNTVNGAGIGAGKLTGGVYVSLGDECEEGWVEYGGSCYQKLNNPNQLFTYEEAQMQCENIQSRLVTIEHERENDFLQNFIKGQTTWIGLNTFSTSSATSLKWEWDIYKNWINNVNDYITQSSSIVKSVSYGKVDGNGAVVNDVQNHILGLKSIYIGYNRNQIVFLRFEYWDIDGRTPVTGTSIGLSGTITDDYHIEMNPEDRIISVEGIFTEKDGIHSLSFVVSQTIANGEYITHGPIGSPIPKDAKTFRFFPTGNIVGIYGSSLLKGISYLGFYTIFKPSCAELGAIDGYWYPIFCHDKQIRPVSKYICEKISKTTKLNCPSGWYPYGKDGRCFLIEQKNYISWEDARQYCKTMEADLIRINSKEENNFLLWLLQNHDKTTNLLDGSGTSNGNSLSVNAFIGYHLPFSTSEEEWQWPQYENWFHEKESSSSNDNINIQKPTEPILSGGCAILSKSINHNNGQWITIGCDQVLSKSNPTICEMQPKDDQCNCFEGWTKHDCSCYRKLPTAFNTWIDAYQACHSFNGQYDLIENMQNGETPEEEVTQKVIHPLAALVDIGSESENVYITSLLDANEATYIARSATLNSKIYSNLYYTNWAPNEPSNPFSILSTSNMMSSMYTSTSTTTIPVPPNPNSDSSSSSSSRTSSIPSLCGAIRYDGKWLAYPCSNRFRSIVCKQSMPTTSPKLSSSYNTDSKTLRNRKSIFSLIQVGDDSTSSQSFDFSNTKFRFGQSIPIRIRQGKNGPFLIVDPSRKSDNILASYINNNNNDYSQSYLLEASIFDVYFLDGIDGFIFQNRLNKKYLSVDSLTGKLITVVGNDNAIKDVILKPFSRGNRKLYPRHRRNLQERVYDNYNNKNEEINNLGISIFGTTVAFIPFVMQNLKITIAVREGSGSTDQSYQGRLMYCSLNVYDLSQTSDSYCCIYADETNNSGLPAILLVLTKLSIEDKTISIASRRPLPNGRFRCENNSPIETATCTTEYTEVITTSTEFEIAAGVSFASEWEYNYNWQPLNAITFFDLNGVLFNWMIAARAGASYTETNEYSTTRTYSMSVPVIPMSLLSLQYWISSTTITYLWEASLQAVGEFEISSLGVKFGPTHSLTSLSYDDDLLFNQWGRYMEPCQTQITVTADMMDDSVEGNDQGSGYEYRRLFEESFNVSFEYQYQKYMKENPNEKSEIPKRDKSELDESDDSRLKQEKIITWEEIVKNLDLTKEQNSSRKKTKRELFKLVDKEAIVIEPTFDRRQE